MNKGAETFASRFVDGELTKEELRRAVYLAVHQPGFREQVRTELALRELVRLSCGGILSTVERKGRR